MKIFSVFAILMSLSFQAAAGEFTEAEAESLTQMNFSGCFGASMKKHPTSDEPAVRDYCQCFAKSLVARSTPDKNFARYIHYHDPLGREQFLILKEINAACLHQSGLTPTPVQ